MGKYFFEFFLGELKSDKYIFVRWVSEYCKIFRLQDTHIF